MSVIAVVWYDFVVIPREARDLQLLKFPKKLQIPRRLRSSE